MSHQAKVSSCSAATCILELAIAAFFFCFSRTIVSSQNAILGSFNLTTIFARSRSLAIDCTRASLHHERQDLK